MWYAYQGGKCGAACYGCCTQIEKLAKITADGEDITQQIGGAASVVCVNIDSFGAGVDLWASPTGKTADIGGQHEATDGKLEIVGIGKGADLGAYQVSKCCASFDRLAQAKDIKWTITECVHMEVDGEAWFLEASSDAPCTIEITQDESFPMLRHKEAAEQK